MAAIRHLVGWGGLVFIPFLLITSHASGRIVNYLDDEDLALAMKYDGEYNPTKPEERSQALAIKHYLAYAERCTDSGQRAEVYAQIAVIYGAAFDPSKGEERDSAKAEEYCKKAIAEEPERLSRNMLRARTFQYGALDRAERFAYRQEVYAWRRRL